LGAKSKQRGSGWGVKTFQVRTLVERGKGAANRHTGRLFRSEDRRGTRYWSVEVYGARTGGA